MCSTYEVSWSAGTSMGVVREMRRVGLSKWTRWRPGVSWTVSGVSWAVGSSSIVKEAHGVAPIVTARGAVVGAGAGGVTRTCLAPIVGGVTCLMAGVGGFGGGF